MNEAYLEQKLEEKEHELAVVETNYDILKFQTVCYAVKIAEQFPDEFAKEMARREEAARNGNL